MEEGVWATVCQALSARVKHTYSVVSGKPYMFLRREFMVVDAEEYTERWSGGGWA